ncbi:MAG TPA: cytochrome c [Acidisarcina sp.]|nr:cytochrome c [Acidisarcina sp.]
MPKHVLVFAMAALFLPAIFGMAQQQDSVKKVPVKPTSPVSGKEMYGAYCATCHGTDGKGNGPAAAALKTHPTDLTMLAKNNGNKFPQDHIVSVLRFGSELPSHGSVDMPVWGPVLHSMNRSNSAEEQQRISNLTRYLKTIQQ